MVETCELNIDQQIVGTIKSNIKREVNGNYICLSYNIPEDYDIENLANFCESLKEVARDVDKMFELIKENQELYNDFLIYVIRYEISIDQTTNELFFENSMANYSIFSSLYNLDNKTKKKLDFHYELDTMYRVFVEILLRIKNNIEYLKIISNSTNKFNLLELLEICIEVNKIEYIDYILDKITEKLIDDDITLDILFHYIQNLIDKNTSSFDKFINLIYIIQKKYPDKKLNRDKIISNAKNSISIAEHGRYLDNKLSEKKIAFAKNKIKYCEEYNI
jgi:hypothetical protein